MPGYRVEDSNPEMSCEMEDYIIDSIIVSKVRNGGNQSEMAPDLKEKFEYHFGGKWVVFITGNIVKSNVGRGKPIIMIINER